MERIHSAHVISDHKKAKYFRMKREGLWFTTIASILLGALFAAVFFTSCKDENVEKIGVCPAVIATDPANLATSVPLGQVITVTFNEAMDPATITPSAFTLVSDVSRKSGSTSASTPVAGTVSYSGVTASFTPSVDLTINTTYTCGMSTLVKDLTGNALQVDYVWTFSTGITLAPTVISTDPINNAACVALNKVVTATFSVPMDLTSITNTTFTITQDATPVAGTVSYTASTASFTPTASFTQNLVYTCTLTTGVLNADGTPLTNNYVWTFTAGCDPVPTVSSTNPANNVTGVAQNIIVTATFSMPMDELTITDGTFILKQAGTPVDGTVSYTGLVASFDPTNDLLPGAIYTATITTGAMNEDGTPMVVNYVWTFTTTSTTAPTVNSTDPANNATDIALDKTITATFSMAMDQLTINDATFTLSQGPTSVPGTVSYSGTTASFIPTGGLLSGTSYTATITTGAKNEMGTPLENETVWTFSTIATLGPLVVDLKTVARFGIIAGVGVSNNAGPSVINDLDVGISPGLRSSVTGFPPATIVNGAIYASDDLAPAGVAAMLTQAKQDLTDAYLFAEGATSPAPATVSGDLGGTTLAPGIYKSTSTLLIQSGNLTLDAQGDENAVWIFQIESAFTTTGGAGGNVILTGKAQAKNIFWQTGSSATIGDNTIFYGNVLALTSITMNANATATGRMLAINGSVIMTSTNIINKP
jgi:hypothetical protein